MSRFTAFFSRKENLLMICILITAACLRLFRIRDYLTFLGDEGRDVLVVYQMLQGDITLLGPTASVGGFFLGPMYYYLMTPFLWLFGYDPVGPAVMVALMGVATVWLVYWITSQWFSTRAGIIAASLYAISPLVIAYSRSSWNPNPMPLFTLLFLWSVYQGVRLLVNGVVSWKWWIGAGFLFGILIQLHYLALFIAVIAGVYIILSFLLLRTTTISRYLVNTAQSIGYTFGGFLITFAPFILFEIRHGFLNTMNIIRFIFTSEETGANMQFISTVWDVLFRTFGRVALYFPQQDHMNRYGELLVSAWWVLVFLTLCGSGWYVIRRLQSTSRDTRLAMILLCVWIVVGVGLFGLYRKPIYDYYLGFLFPVPFMMIGYLIDRLAAGSVITKSIGWFLFSMIFLINLSGIPFQYEPNRQLNQVETIARTVYDMAEGKPYNFALLSGGNSDHAYRFFLTKWGNPPVIIQNDAVDPDRSTVTDQLIVVCESLPCAPLGNSLWEIAGFGRAEIAEKKEIIVVEVYKLVRHRE